MLDLKAIRANPEVIKDSIKKRWWNLDLDKFLEIDKKRNEFIWKIDELRELRNKVSKEIPTLANEEKAEKIK